MKNRSWFIHSSGDKTECIYWLKVPVNYLCNPKVPHLLEVTIETASSTVVHLGSFPGIG